MAAYANQIAHIQQLKKPESMLSDRIFPDVYLQPRAGALDMCERRFAMQPDGHHPPRDAHVDALCFERSRVPRTVRIHDFCGRSSVVKAVRISFFAQRGNFGELFLALEILIERLELQRPSFAKNDA